MQPVIVSYHHEFKHVCSGGVKYWPFLALFHTGELAQIPHLTT
jgi:hypothetical protein